MEAQEQKAVAIIAFDTCSFNRTGELNDFFEAAVSDFQLIMRNALAAKTIAAETAKPQEFSVKPDFNIVRSDSRQVYLDQPSFGGAVNVGGGIPKASGRTAVLRIVTTAKESLKRVTSHSIQLSFAEFRGLP